MCVAVRTFASLLVACDSYLTLRDAGVASTPTPRIKSMVYTIAVVLVVLWLLGLVTSYTLGGFIHVLLVVAIIVVLIRVIQGRRL
jgi:hypothetical protein